MNTNLLYETEVRIARHGKSPAHVIWVGSRDGRLAISWDEFALIAKDINYDSGFGGHEIQLDLVVVGSNWWLERREYDGSESWSFKSAPQRKEGRPFNKLKVYDDDTGRYKWATLAEANGLDDD